MKLRGTFQFFEHVRHVPALFRGELMIGSGQLFAAIGRWDGKPMPDRELEPEQWEEEVRRRYRFEFPRGIAEHYVVDHDRGPLGILVCRRKITGDFVTNLVENMAGDESDISQYKFHDTGTGTTAEANTDSGLETPAGPTTRVMGTQATGGTATAPTYTTVATIGPYPTAASITEHIVATTAERSTTKILDRSVFSASALAIDVSDVVTATYVATFNAEA